MAACEPFIMGTGGWEHPPLWISVTPTCSLCIRSTCCPLFFFLISSLLYCLLLCSISSSSSRQKDESFGPLSFLRPPPHQVLETSMGVLITSLENPQLHSRLQSLLSTIFDLPWNTICGHQKSQVSPDKRGRECMADTFSLASEI